MSKQLVSAGGWTGANVGAAACGARNPAFKLRCELILGHEGVHSSADENTPRGYRWWRFGNADPMTPPCPLCGQAKPVKKVGPKPNWKTSE